MRFVVALALLLVVSAVQISADDNIVAKIPVVPVVEASPPAAIQEAPVTSTKQVDAACDVTAVLRGVLLDAVAAVKPTVMPALDALSSVLPVAALPHFRNVHNGALSTFYGPLSFVSETSAVESFWTVKKCLCCLSKLIAAVSDDVKQFALRRLEFSVGSFFMEALVFAVLSRVARRATTKYSVVSHTTWFAMLALAAVPTGVMDVSAFVAAAFGVNADVFYSSLFVGKLLRPYVTTWFLWALRFAALHQLEFAQDVIRAGQSWYRSASSSSFFASDDATVLITVLISIGMLFGAASYLFPSEEIFDDDE